MCLTPAFFDGREALIRTREAAGDIELVHFLKPRHVSIDRLYLFGILRDDREYLSTTDLFTHQVAEQGMAFLDRDEGYQLIFVRNDRVAAFGTFLNRARRTHPGLGCG